MSHVSEPKVEDKPVYLKDSGWWGAGILALAFLFVFGMWAGSGWHVTWWVLLLWVGIGAFWWWSLIYGIVWRWRMDVHRAYYRGVQAAAARIREPPLVDRSDGSGQ